MDPPADEYALIRTGNLSLMPIVKMESSRIIRVDFKSLSFFILGYEQEGVALAKSHLSYFPNDTS